MNGPRQRRLIVLLFVSLAIAAGWSYLRLASSRRVAQAAAEDLDRCRQLGLQIERLSRAPTEAWLEGQTRQEKLILHIQQAAQTTEIAESSLVRIDPQPSRRIGETDYLDGPTLLQLRNVSLEQLARLLKEIIADQSGLFIESIRLSAPRSVPSSEGDERWTAEVVLTQLVFSPKSSASRP